MIMPIVVTENLTKVYKMGKNDVRALSGVSLAIERGSMTAIMGRSGSGKSTLLHLLGCLDRPTSGTILLDGLDVTAVAKGELPKVRREKLGFVFQSFNLLPTLTALENVMLPLRYSSVARAEQEQRAHEALGWVELEERATHRPAELSGGEQQRVAVARSLINRPALVLADEPTGELDTQTSKAIMQLLRALNIERGQTFIIVTHDPGVAAQTDRIIHFSDGKVLREETPQRPSGT